MAAILELFARQTRKAASTPAQAKVLPTPKHNFEGHKEAIWSFVFLHDNTHVVSCSVDGTMRKWNCDTGLMVGEAWKGEGGRIYAMALSPDGKMVVCGRNDGSVQRWNTDGEMIEGVWTGHRKAVRSLSWSPNKNHIASGSDDGTILIRKAENGEVEVGPIKTQHWQDENLYEIWSLAYSPSEERIASGGNNNTICIWDSKTGKPVVGPIKGLQNVVTSVVWSSDSTKLYSASDNLARVFDSKTGELLHHYAHNDDLYSVALSPKHNVLACVGWDGIANLWDTESHQLLGRSSGRHRKALRHVAFSQDGRYLAHGGYDGKLTLWIANDLAPGLTQQQNQPEFPSLSRLDAHAARPSGGDDSFEEVQDRIQGTQQEARPESTSLSFLNVDATNPLGGGGILEEVRDNPYVNFFQSSLPAATSGSPQPSNPSSARRFWNTISRRHEPANESTPLRKRPKRRFLARRARSNLPPNTTSDQPMPEGKVQVGEKAETIDQDVDLGAIKPEKGKDEQQKVSVVDAQSPAKLESEENRNFWERLKRVGGKDPACINTNTATKRPEVVEVYAVRGYQGYVAMPPKRRRKSQVAACSTPLAASHTSGSLQPPGPSSSTGPARAGPMFQASSGQGKPSLAGIHETQYLQAVGGSSSHTSPSHFVTTYHTSHDSDSRSSIEGTCNRFLDRICFPRGHYHKDS